MREDAIRFLEALLSWFEYSDIVPAEYFDISYHDKVMQAISERLVDSSLVDAPAGELGVAVLEVRAIATKWKNLEGLGYVNREIANRLLTQLIRHCEPNLSGVISVDGRLYISRKRILDTHGVTTSAINAWYLKGFPKHEHKRSKTLYYDLEKVNEWFESQGMLKVIL